MRRHTAAVFVLLAALFAVPASAGPIVFVSGPSPVALVAGTLTISGPEVNGGLFLLEAAGAPGSWPGGGSTQAGFPANDIPAVLLGAGKPIGAGRPAQLPAQGGSSKPSLTLPFQLTGTLLGIQLTGQEAQLLFALSLVGPGMVTLQLFPESQLTPFDSGGGASVPEPASLVLISSGLAGLIVARRRRQGRKNT